MGKHIPRIHNGYNIRYKGSSSDQFNAVTIDVKAIAMTIISLMESIFYYFLVICCYDVVCQSCFIPYH